MVKFLGAAMMVVLSLAASAQDVGLTATAERQEIRIGEPVVVTVSARLSVDVDSIGPLPADSIGLFEVLGYTHDDDLRWSFELMTIDTGSVFLPPIAFGYAVSGDTASRKAYANSLMFTVRGIDVPPDADIRDIKPPLNAPWGWGDIWPYLLVAAILGAGWFVYTKFFRKENVPVDEPVSRPPPIPPHTLALRALRDLEDKKLWQQGRTKEYYSECTEIIRRFFEGRFGFLALELTSAETLDALRTNDVDPAVLEVLEEFFVTADMVKFAKRQPAPEEHERELAIAYDVVRALTPQPDPPSEHKEMSLVG